MADDKLFAMVVAEWGMVCNMRVVDFGMVVGDGALNPMLKCG